MKDLLLLLCIFTASCCSQATNRVTSHDHKGCIDSMIAQFKAEEKQNPPRKIYSYTYNGNTVYYVTPPCCDFFSDLYNDKCELIAHPDGGITGKGDGRATDFVASRTDEKLI